MSGHDVEIWSRNEQHDTMTLIYKTQSFREARIVEEFARSAGCACIARERTEVFVKCGGSARLVIWFEVFALPH